MPNYMLAYHGGAMPETPEAIEAEMELWRVWMEKHDASFVDQGNPVGKSYTLSSGAVEDNGGSNPLSGYSIIKADDLDAAMAIAKESPHLNSGTLELAEIIEM